jgi:hypothetical protein
MPRNSRRAAVPPVGRQAGENVSTMKEHEHADKNRSKAKPAHDEVAKAAYPKPFSHDPPTS